MNAPVQITFRNMPESEAIKNNILKRVVHLERLFNRIVSCNVMVEAPHRHHKKGKHYKLRIDLNVPGKEIVVSRDPSQNATHSDAYVAIRDAFSAAQRQLLDYLRVRRGEIKQHEAESPITLVGSEKKEDYNDWEQAM